MLAKGTGFFGSKKRWVAFNRSKFTVIQWFSEMSLAREIPVVVVMR